MAGSWYTPKRAALLAAVAQDRVTYRAAGRGTSFRLWASDHPQEREFVTETPTVRALIELGLARTERGFRFQHGTVVATVEGWSVLFGLLEPFWAAFARWPG